MKTIPRFCLSCMVKYARPMGIGPAKSPRFKGIHWEWSCSCGNRVSATREEYEDVMRESMEKKVRTRGS